MSPEIQTVAVFVILGASLLFIARRLLRARKKSGCGGACGCSKAR
ncbi:MAG TPA: FeoB-associated Cys-rich membrane protein [Chthoniobacterales bacterium]